MQSDLAKPATPAPHWLTSEAAYVETNCPSCGGQNSSCPDGCGRDPETGELNGTRLARSHNTIFVLRITGLCANPGHGARATRRAWRHALNFTPPSLVAGGVFRAGGEQFRIAGVIVRARRPPAVWRTDHVQEQIVTRFHHYG